MNVGENLKNRTKVSKLRLFHEQLFRSVYFEVEHIEYFKPLAGISDFHLLKKLNDVLVKGNCTPLTQDELEADLS